MGFFLLLALMGMALLVAWLIDAPRGSWRYVLAAGVLIAFAGRLPPPGSPLRVDLPVSAAGIFWAAAIAAPIAAYGLILRELRRRARPVVGPPATGLVRIVEDADLAADTSAALAADTEAALGAAPRAVSLAWRAEDEALAGHLRMRQIGETAEIELLWVGAAHRGRGIGGRMLAAAEDLARDGGARRMAVVLGDWQAGGFFDRAGFRCVADRPLGPAMRRLWLEKELM